MLTAKSEVFDRIQGLEMGADDYIVKPFEMKELLARINAVLRRTEIPNDTSKKLTFDKLVINLDSYELIVDDKKIDTPPKELELLYHLATTPNRVYTRNQLLDEVWGFDYFGDSRTVDVHIKRLREKVENVSDQWALKTVWGVGYKFEVVGGSGKQPEKSCGIQLLPLQGGTAHNRNEHHSPAAAEQPVSQSRSGARNSPPPLLVHFQSPPSLYVFPEAAPPGILRLEPQGPDSGLAELCYNFSLKLSQSTHLHSVGLDSWIPPPRRSR